MKASDKVWSSCPQNPIPDTGAVRFRRCGAGVSAATAPQLLPPAQGPVRAGGPLSSCKLKPGDICVKSQNPM